MDSTNPNKWLRPWTTEELRENAENWSLAGDVALLSTIKAFSEKLLSKTGEISDKIDTLLNNVDEAGLKLDLAQNEFQNLKNTQFIESRVYDDDETLDSKEEERVTEPPIPEDEQEKLVIKSIKMGMEILDEYYDKLEVSVSDSEEDTDKSKFYDYILKPKDMYAHRPLPPIIGTDEWYKKWHLDISSSDSESDKVSEIYSESDSEDNLPKDLIKGSETSSELDFSSHASENKPVASSTFNSSHHPDLESSSPEIEEQDSQLDKTPLGNKSFAEQLAAKLGNIISEQEVVPKEVNKRPIQPAKTSDIVGIPFNDEPPPLDDLEHSILPKSIHTGYFSGGQGLFDDDNDEDEPFWGQPNKSAEGFDEPTIKEPKQHGKSKVTKGLFDESSSDEDMFTKTKKQIDNKYLSPMQHPIGFYDEKPPDIQEKSKSPRDEPEKKPIGGVRLMGTPDIFNDKKISKILRSSAAENTDENEQPPKINTVKQENSTKPKRRNLFDDDEFDDFLYIEKKTDEPKKTNYGKTNNLFDDDIIETNVEKTTNKSFEINKTTTDKKLSLFDDDDNVEAVLNQPKKISLFDDDDELFNEDEDFFSSITKTKLTSKLFEDIGEEKNDDMFNIKIKSEGVKKDLFSEDADPEITVNSDKKSENHSKSESPSESYEIKTDHLDIINTEENSSATNEATDITKPVVTSTKQSLQKTNEIKQKTSGQDLNATKITNEETDISKPVDTSTEQSLQKTDKIKQKASGLFDDSDFEDDIFGSKIKFKEDKLESHQNMNVESIEDVKNIEVEVKKVEKSSLEAKYPKDSKEQDDIQPPSIVPQDLLPPKPKEEPSTISIRPFDSLPPPDDFEDWDAKSDSLSDLDEIASYRADEDYNRSSIFDEEPPSLEPNESSGIVRDYSTNRTETDDSFMPPASSSRRLSSEIFSEQQSQDSFFVTKNKTESVNPVSLDVIPELGQTDVTDITPSGDIQNFDSTTVSAISSQQQTLNTEAEEVESRSIEDMLPIRNSASENILNRIASFEKSLQRDGPDKPLIEPKSSPGKLKHNLLNINVNALRPTLRPPKIRPRSLHVDETDYLASEKQGNVPSPVTPKSVTFNEQVRKEDNEEKVEVLHSITKDRVKIPVKRRPSTRKGRLEAIRRSAADLPFHEEDYKNMNENSIDPPTSDEKTTRLSERNDVMATETTNKEPALNVIEKPDNLYNQRAVNKIDITKTVSTETSKKSIAGLFNSSSSESEMSTESPKKISKSTEILPPSSSKNHVAKELEIPNRTKKISRLFDDDASGDEILSSDKDLVTTRPKNPTKLFSDSDEEVFSSFKSNKTENETRKIVVGSDFLASDSKKASNLFGGSDEEIFSTVKPVEATVKTGETIKESVVKKMTKLFNESDEETASHKTKDKVQPTTENKSAIKKTTKLFNETDDELFSNVSKGSTGKKNAGLFGSGDESDDGLFQNSIAKSVAGITTASVSKTVFPKSQEHSKKSLFNDSSSDDDLFSSTNKSRKQDRRPRQPLKSQTKPQGFKKSENKETTEDPLSKLF